MIDITVWMDGFLKALHDTFENRVWFVGLQGSYGRGEATETSLKVPNLKVHPYPKQSRKSVLCWERYLTLHCIFECL